MSSASVFSQSSSHFMVRRSLCGFSRLIQKRNVRHACRFTIVKLNLVLTGFHVQCYSSRRTRSLKVDPGSSMEEEKNAFYVVRKGNMVGVYKSLSDCQDQVSSSICDPSVGVYKGYSLSKEAQEYLASRGLRNPMYTIDAADVKEDLFGNIVPCPFQQPDSSDGNKLRKISPQKRSSESVELFRNSEEAGSTTLLLDFPQKNVRAEYDYPQKNAKVEYDFPQKNLKVEYDVDACRGTSNKSCIIEFDGASKGNPGLAGAGAVVRTTDRKVICRLREGLGVTTNNVAEYRALLLGMKYAVKKGFQNVSIQGDSQLVCFQVQDKWQAKNKNMIDLLTEAKELKKQFRSFQITHVLRAFNSEADEQANLALELRAGEVKEVYDH